MAVNSTGAETIAVNQSDARVLAQQAYLTGDPVLAYGIAERILAQDPRDVHALLLIAATAPTLGKPQQGRMAGRAAWKFSRHANVSNALRFEIARYTAQAALVEGSPLRAQFWLRRSLDVAPDGRSLDKTSTDLSQLLARTKLRYSLKVSISPSNNLNGGAPGKDLTIDDWYYVGSVSASAQALAGVRATVRGGLSYRFDPTVKGQTELGMTVTATANKLSAAAKDMIAHDPQLGGRSFKGTDLNRLSVEASIQRSFTTANGKLAATVQLAAGQNWVGQELLGPNIKAKLEFPIQRKADSGLTFSTSFERYFQSVGNVDGRDFELDGFYGLGAGHFIYGVGLAQQRSGDPNGTFDQWTASVGYSFDKPIGPARVTAVAAASQRDYSEFLIRPFAVTDGRHDNRLALTLDLGFPDAAVMGFEPTVTVTRSTTASNISKFDNQEVSVGFGMAAKF